MKAPSVKPVRCAIYTRVSTDHGLDQELTRWMPSMMLRQPISRVRPMPAGPWSGPVMMTAGIPAGPPTAPTFRSCWMIFAPGRSTSSSSTKSTA